MLNWIPSLPADSEKLFLVIVAGAFTILGALIGAVIGVIFTWYRERLSARRDLLPVGVRLAALAIRARQEVIAQFVAMNEGPWIEEAIGRQKYLFDDLEAVIGTLRADTADLYILLWAARDALDSNMGVLDSWRDTQERQYHSTASIEHIGPDIPSHLDLFSAAEMLRQAVERIPDKKVRNQSRSLPETISEVRRQANARLQPTIEQLKKMDESERDKWVRTGRLP